MRIQWENQWKHLTCCRHSKARMSSALWFPTHIRDRKCNHTIWCFLFTCYASFFTETLMGIVIIKMQASGTVEAHHRNSPEAWNSRKLNSGWREEGPWKWTITQNVQLPVTDNKFKGGNDYLELTRPSKNSWKSWKLREALKVGPDNRYGKKTKKSLR